MSQPEAPTLETDPRFPSGPWTGYFLQHRSKRMMELHITFLQGALTGEGRDYVGPFVLRGRYELTDGKWRRSETTRADQPPNGFTVSADVRPYYVDLLCETYQASDEEGRKLTQTLAQLSISKAEGVPTRRYLP